jgi:carboxylesterase type B
MWAACVVFGLMARSGALAQSAAKRTVNIQVEQGALSCLSSAGSIKCLGVPYAAPPVGALRLRPSAASRGSGGVGSASGFAWWCLKG